MKKNEYEVNRKRGDALLQRKLYKRAAEMLRKAADYADTKESTWARVYAESGLNLMRAAEGL